MIPKIAIPLRLGADAEFAALTSALTRLQFTEQDVAGRLGLERISQFRLTGATHLGATHLDDEPADTLGRLIRLLMEGAILSIEQARSLPLEELIALDVVAPHGPGHFAATVMLYPMHGLYIASDRTRSVEGDLSKPIDDIVYPAIVPNTDRFLSMIPETPCDAALDLCSGTGVAALVAARCGARHAWALDLTERSTHFAEFNRRLNGIETVTALQGDLYQPAGDLTFDRIVAHPPYVPVYRQEMIFDSGGQDGEQIVRGIIEGLPKHLRPGGRFYGLTMGTDRQQPFQLRLREWLGDAESEFDVAFTVLKTMTPHEYASDAVISRRGPVNDITGWRDLFKQLRVEGLAYGFLTIQRRESTRPVFTVRRQAGPRTTASEHEWLLNWETTVVEGGAALLAARPRAARGIRLVVDNVLEGDGWTPQSYRLESDYPFRMEMQAQAWTAYLIHSADGTMTMSELLEKLKADGAVHPDTPANEFARMVHLLVSGGFLESVTPPATARVKPPVTE